MIFILFDTFILGLLIVFELFGLGLVGYRHSGCQGCGLVFRCLGVGVKGHFVWQNERWDDYHTNCGVDCSTEE